MLNTSNAEMIKIVIILLYHILNGYKTISIMFQLDNPAQREPSLLGTTVAAFDQQVFVLSALALPTRTKASPSPGTISLSLNLSVFVRSLLHPHKNKRW